MEKSKRLEKRLKKIGDKIRQLRIKKGYKSAETFSFDHEISRVQYWRMENGANITMSTLIRVLDIHNVALDEFFDGLE